ESQNLYPTWNDNSQTISSRLIVGDTGASTITISNQSGSGLLALTGDISADGTGTRTMVFNALGNILVSGAIDNVSYVHNASPATNPTHLIKLGQGTLTLSADNSNYRGATTIGGGILAITNGNALGNAGTGVGTSISPSGTLLMANTGITLAENFTFSGSSTTLSQVKQTGNFQNTLTGNIVVMRAVAAST